MEMKRRKNRVKVKNRATILVRVMSDSWFGIGSMVSICHYGCNCGHRR